MDKKLTLDVNETFISLLLEIQTAQKKANFLLDSNGMARAEGFVDKVVSKGTTSYVELKGGTKLAIKSIVAINGVFLPDYAEC
jgi:hypothetical protein